MKILCTILLALVLFSTACTSSKEEEPGEVSMQEPMEPAPAPSTAKASALVKGCQEADDAFRCTLKIEQVNGYGAGTPPLPVGTEIETMVPKSVFGEDPTGSKAAAMLAMDHTVSVTLQHRKVLSTGGETPPAWRVLDIK